MKRGRNAPRLLTRQSRDRITQQLPPKVLEGIQQIAKTEKQSVSWVVEQVIVDYFSLDKDQYKVSKNGKGK